MKLCCGLPYIKLGITTALDREHLDSECGAHLRMNSYSLSAKFLNIGGYFNKSGTLPRAFRKVAILLMLTLNFVIKIFLIVVTFNSTKNKVKGRVLPFDYFA
jgi:hypothetical protein